MADDDLVGVGSRREGRETALGILYQAEITGREVAEVLATLPVPAEPFVADLAGGVGAHQSELDALLDSYARDWTVARMPVLDRLVLRMGAFELLHRPDVPPGVALSEAVDLAAQYSTERSSTFVNGVLARIADDVR